MGQWDESEYILIIKIIPEFSLCLAPESEMMKQSEPSGNLGEIYECP